MHTSEPSLPVFRSTVRVERHDLTYVSTRFIGGQLERVHASQHFLAGLPDRLARFRDDQIGKRVLVTLHKRCANL
jgi:hypothetical protein